MYEIIDMKSTAINNKTIKSFGRMRLAVVLIAMAITGCLKASSVETVPERHGDVKKVLFVGDSMTGWLSERLNAYGKENGFEVSTVVWDGSTINKWGNSAGLVRTVREEDPDALFISLGMNDLFEKRPEARFGEALEKIRAVAGKRPIVWIGPLAWQGHDKGKEMDEWLAESLGERSYFSSFNLSVPRQSARNPHPTKAGMMEWMDAVMEWIPESAAQLPGVKKPQGVQMLRGKNFIYKRMNEKF